MRSPPYDERSVRSMKLTALGPGDGGPAYEWKCEMINLTALLQAHERKNKHMDTFGIMGFMFGMMGFIFSMSATKQASQAKKDVEELTKEIEKLKSQVGPRS